MSHQVRKTCLQTKLKYSKNLTVPAHYLHNLEFNRSQKSLTHQNYMTKQFKTILNYLFTIENSSAILLTSVHCLIMIVQLLILSLKLQ